MRALLFLFLLCWRLAGAAELPPYQDRLGRQQPVVAVVGLNGGTELTDFVIPYGVLAASSVAQVLAVGTEPGPLRLRPALRIQADATLAEFDQRFPEGADYVIVPAVVAPGDSTLVAWVASQGDKGATVVSICDGAFVVANAGLLRGHRATAHWASAAYRKKQYPDTRWVDKLRYVADGKRMSTAGVSAALPAALALVEAIGGSERAVALAGRLGVSDWSSTHDSDAFRPRLGANLGAYLTGYTNQWFHTPERLGIAIAPGVDEIGLAFRADAWARSKRSRVETVAASTAPLTSRHGLRILPDLEVGGADAPTMQPARASEGLPGQALDEARAGLAQRYGHRTAFLVALEFEYPSYR
jgi:putative intracellular protease/amidase